MGTNQSDIIIFTYHSSLKYMLTKQNAKARLIRWVLILQEFNLQIRDKKGVVNVVADHQFHFTEELVDCPEEQQEAYDMNIV